LRQLLVRELRAGEESLWFRLDDEGERDGATEPNRSREFRDLFEKASERDPRTFVIALEGQRPVGRLRGVFVDRGTYIVTEMRTAEGVPCSVIEDALIAHLASTFSRDGVTVLSNDRPRNSEINSALERAGFEIEKTKAYVGRSLDGELPDPGVGFTFQPLAVVGRKEFVRVMAAAAEGDPFEEMEGRDPDADFQELVELAGDLFDESSWFLAAVGGKTVGVVLPQAFPDNDSQGTLFYVAILPVFRGRGYGRALHAAGLSLLAGRGVTDYVGSTDTRNAPMLRVFERNECPRTTTQLFFRPPSIRPA
jgi:GNAT superfamily N-acetyltransferase